MTKYRFSTLIMLLALAAGFSFLSCEKDEPEVIRLDSFGPSPVLRGGDLKFIGEHLDKVSEIVLTSGVSVTSFKSRSPQLLVITVPEATVDGKVVLKTPDGDIETKTILTISEPIAITSITPARVRPGDIVTINGDYLNLVREVIFNNKKTVTVFQSQSREKLEVKVPDDAQTGKVVVSNGEPDPIQVESETDLEIALPMALLVSPNPVKAGAELTIEGEDLDLAQKVVFGGGSSVDQFVSREAGKLVVAVPADAQDGKLGLIAASQVQTESAVSLVMVVPAIADINPNPAKNGGTVTITGTDLDLVTSVVFGGGKNGEIQNASATELTVKVPDDATAAAVTLNTAANKSVASTAVLGLVKPVIESFSPMETQANKDITITGTDLDLVVKVIFGGDKEGTIVSASATELTVTVPPGTLSGAFTLVARNGDMTVSTQELTILASNVPIILSMPTQAKPGEMITIEGEKLDLLTDVIFPVGIKATMFGIKTATILQVVVPPDVQKGIGVITFVTSENETTTSPPINFQGVDVVADPTLVFFNFDNLNRWWGDTGDNENDPDLSLDGSNYFRVNGSLSGWTGFFWRNGKNEFPADVIGTNVSSYVLKFDVNILEPITGGEFAWRFKGSSGDFWYYWKPWEATGSYMTPGWITVTIPLTAFSAGGTPITDMSTINEDFGVAFNSGSSTVNACFDNVRFELQ